MQAKHLLSTEYSDYTMDIIELDMMQNYQQANEIQRNVANMTGIRTVPQVFIYGQCIGGATDTMYKHKSGELEQLLRDGISSSDYDSTSDSSSDNDNDNDGNETISDSSSDDDDDRR